MNRKIVTACVVALIVPGMCLLLWQFGSRDASDGPSCELLAVGPTQVTIAWNAEKPSLGRIWYRPVRGREPGTVVADPLGATTAHEIVIGGLQPGTRYRYWLDGAEDGPRWEFQTAPPVSGPFSFLLTWGDVSRSAAPLVMSETPEFVLSLTPIDFARRDPFASVRPYLPVYDLRGVNSPYLARLGEDAAVKTEESGWPLDCAGLRLAVLDDDGRRIPDLAASPAAHTVGVILQSLPGCSVGGDSSRRLKQFPAAPSATGVASYKDPASDFSTAPWLIDGRLSVEAIEQSQFHATLLEHNRRWGSRPVAFVIVPARVDANIEIGGVRYVAIDSRDGTSGAARIDVAVESCRLTFVHPAGAAEADEIVLREPPLAQKRTCAECRRLADQGAYEESIAAYEAFIESNQGHFQIDDAHYAIAEILDEQLFRYEEALRWYRRLIEEYPDCTLAPMARGRIAFLAAHADFDYRPLASFERVRRVRFARSLKDPRARDACLAEVEQIVAEYPQCKIAPLMRYWLANQYRRHAPDRAVELYRSLLQRHADSSQAEDAWIEMGETYYDAGQYEKALSVFEEALGAVAGRADEIRTQMDRARRNLRRQDLAVAGWLVLAGLFLAGLFLPPVGVRFGQWRPAACALVLLSLFLLGYGWFIREQFSSTTELIVLAIALAAVSTVGVPFSSALGRKLCGRRCQGRVARAILGCLFGLAMFIVGGYLVIYYVNPHYLIVVNL